MRICCMFILAIRAFICCRSCETGRNQRLVSFHGMDIMLRDEEPGYNHRLRELVGERCLSFSHAASRSQRGSWNWAARPQKSASIAQECRWKDFHTSRTLFLPAADGA